MGRSTYVIRAGGEVDLADVEALRTASFAAGDADLPILVVLDLTHVVSWDSRVPTALIRLRRHLIDRRGVLLLRGASPQLQTELALTGLDRVFVDADQPAPPAPPSIGGHAE
jgi:anti-anti-sigma factor